MPIPSISSILFEMFTIIKILIIDTRGIKIVAKIWCFFSRCSKSNNRRLNINPKINPRAATIRYRLKPFSAIRKGIKSTEITKFITVNTSIIIQYRILFALSLNWAYFFLFSASVTIPIALSTSSLLQPRFFNLSFKSAIQVTLLSRTTGHRPVA